MNKVTEIMDAWLTALYPSEAEKERAEARMKKCKDCLENGYNSLKINVCKKCNCPLNKKVYSRNDDACPLSKWIEVDKNYIEKILTSQKFKNIV